MMPPILFMACAALFGSAGAALADSPALDFLPPPDQRIEFPNEIYGRKSLALKREFDEKRSPAACEALIVILERLLVEDPASRFWRAGPIPVPVAGGRACGLDNWGGPLGLLSNLYAFQGKCYEASVMAVRRILVSAEDLARFGAKASEPFRTWLFVDEASSSELFRQLDQEAIRKGAKLHPLLFLNGWAMRARWKGKEVQQALVSLTDVAYALGRDHWRELLQQDWKAWVFTLTFKGRTYRFQGGSKKATAQGRALQLSRAVERSFYDLYVPVFDLARFLAATFRDPRDSDLFIDSAIAEEMRKKEDFERARVRLCFLQTCFPEARFIVLELPLKAASLPR